MYVRESYNVSRNSAFLDVKKLCKIKLILSLTLLRHKNPIHVMEYTSVNSLIFRDVTRAMNI